jgi:ribonuclease BN (tRNA processing enzyme)
MSEFFLRFLGVGNAQASGLGSSAAVLERGEAPWLLIDCGPDTLQAYVETYSGLPTAIFITHAHLDHIGGLEALFYRLATAASPAEPPRLLIPVELVAVLQRRLADYPNLLAEGGCNFWDVFHPIPVSERFWHRDLLFSVFPVRHHDYLAAFGLALEGRFLFTGDTRPIPEILNRHASRGETIFHDCGTRANPSHTGLPGPGPRIQARAARASGSVPLWLRGRWPDAGGSGLPRRQAGRTTVAGPPPA